MALTIPWSILVQGTDRRGQYLYICSYLQYEPQSRHPYLRLTPDLKPERCPVISEPVEPWESLTQPAFHACHLEISWDYIPWCYPKSVRCISPELLPENPGALTIWASTQLQGSGGGGLWVPYRLQMGHPHLPGMWALCRSR